MAPGRERQRIQSHQPLNLGPGCVFGGILVLAGAARGRQKASSSVAGKPEDEAPHP